MPNRPSSRFFELVRVTTSKSELIDPFDVDALTSAFTPSGSRTLIDEFDVFTVNGLLLYFRSASVTVPFELSRFRARPESNSSIVTSIDPFDVSAEKLPLIPSPLTRPFDVFNLAAPLNSDTSIDPFDVVASTSPFTLHNFTDPFDDFIRTGPSIVSALSAPFDVSTRSITIFFGTLNMNFAPQLQFLSIGLIALTRRYPGSEIASILICSITSRLDADFVPVTSTMSLSQPMISTDPLKLSNDNRPPGVSLYE